MKILPKNSGFKVPNNYFEKLPERVNDKINQNTFIPKNQGFTVPNDYFKSVYENVVTKISAAEEVKIVKLNLSKRKYYLAIAVVAVLLFFASIISNLTTSTTLSFQDIANSEIENYFNKTDFNFSTYDLAQMLPIEDMEIEVTDIIDTKINEEQIINYLESSTGIDIQELYKEDYE